MSESRIARLLHAYGVRRPGDPREDGTMSIREAAEKTGVSRETLGRLMRPLDPRETRRIRKVNLDKLADGLGIPRDVLEQENLADWGYVQAVEASTVANVLSQIHGLGDTDLTTLQMEISQLLRDRAIRRENGDGPLRDDE